GERPIERAIEQPSRRMLDRQAGAEHARGERFAVAQNVVRDGNLALRRRWEPGRCDIRVDRGLPVRRDKLAELVLHIAPAAEIVADQQARVLRLVWRL